MSMWTEASGDLYMGVSHKKGFHFGVPFNQDYGKLGSIFGSPYIGKLPYEVLQGILAAKESGIV